MSYSRLKGAMVVAKRLYAEKIRVRDVMSQPIIIIEQNKPLESVVQMMLPRSIKKLPVLEGRAAGTVISLCRSLNWSRG